ncbi:hypothetical protein RDI58_002371 [Solanum bulbocastanum]|uniref:Uncharacterized protein n=1 Tax=Solanum bulbocastanum TaxID=147425 RepID=A0AAN8YU34_SOLBU
MGVLLEINGCRIPASDTVSITLRRDRVDKGSSEVEGTWDNGNGTGWSVDCYNAASFGSGGSVFLQSKIGVSSPSIEVYVADCFSGVPLILTKTIQVSPRRKLSRHSMLDSIPEDEGVGKEHQYVNGFIPQQKLPITDSELDYYESEGKAGHGFYSEDMYYGEDGQLFWFNAGVRVGVGIGLGMCVGVGIGVGQLMCEDSMNGA